MFKRVFFALVLCMAVAAPAAQAVEPDGALIQLTTGSKWTYRIVGGAPLHITSCAYTNKCEGRKAVASLAGYRAYPRDGAMIFGGTDGGTYRFAGGAPLWVSTCRYAPTCEGRIQIDDASFKDTAHLKAYPLDNTVIRNATDGGLYRFAGGAPLLVRCDLGAGCTGYTSLDGGTFSKLGTATPSTPHMRQFPANGVTVKNSDNNQFYRFAGGAPLTISPQAGGILIDSRTLLQNGTGTSALPHLRPYPTEGTFLNASGALYRVAGSAAVRLTNCAVLPGGCPGPVAVDAGTIAGLGGGRLLATPKDGTVLRGYPSNTLWEIQAGTRRQTFVNVAGIGIDDTAIGYFPVPSTPTPATPPPPFEPLISIGYTVNHKGTKLTALSVRSVPSGSKVTVTCSKRSRGCPYRSKSYSSSLKSGKANLVNRFKHRRIRGGTTVTVKITGPTGARKYQYIKIRTMKRPVRSTKCSAPGAKLGHCS